MVIAIVITNKVSLKYCLSKPYAVIRLLCWPKAGNAAIIRNEPDDEFAFQAGITGGSMF